MEVPKVAVVFLEKILQGFVLERVLLLPFYWVDNDTRDVDIGLGGGISIYHGYSHSAV